MRSRYTAHARRALGYLNATHVPPNGAEAPTNAATDLTWTRLEIIDTAAGTNADDTGTVEFRAHYRTGADEQGIHHERSRFSVQSSPPAP